MVCNHRKKYYCYSLKLKRTEKKNIIFTLTRMLKIIDDNKKCETKIKCVRSTK